VPLYWKDLSFGHNNFGNIYRLTRRYDLAEKSLLRALEIRKKLAADHPAVPIYQNWLAASHDQLAYLYRVMGRNDLAEKSSLLALDVNQKLAATDPGVPDYQAALAGSHHGLAHLYRATGRNELAEKSFLQAIELRKKLVEAHPGVPNYRSGLALAYDHLANLYARTDRNAEAEATYRQALGIYKKLMESLPKVSLYRDNAIGDCLDLGDLYRRTGRFEEAVKTHQEALAHARHLADANPTAWEHRERMALAKHNLGLTYTDMNRFDAAEESYRESIALRTPLPPHPWLQSKQGWSQLNLGEVRRQRGKPSDALKCYAEAIETFTAVLQKDAQEAGAQAGLRQSHANRAAALGQLGRHAEAVADWDRVVALSSGEMRLRGRLLRAQALARAGQHQRAGEEAAELAGDKAATGATLLDLARACSLASSAVGRDAALSAEERSKRADRHAARAVELLSQAAAKGMFNDPEKIAQLKKDPDLISLRDRADLARLLSELERAVKEPKR